MLSCECWQMIGGLDLRTVGCYGWAIDFDLALRARAAGYGLYTTEMAYINHFGRKTGNARFGSWRDEWGGRLATDRGMRKVYGRKWLRRFARVIGAADVAKNGSERNLPGSSARGPNPPNMGC